MALFNELHQEGNTIILITHEQEIADHGQPYHLYQGWRKSITTDPISSHDGQRPHPIQYAMKKINLLMLLLGSLSLTTNAETYVLDLQKSIEIAKEKSYEMLTLYQDLLIADYNLKTANSQFKTHVDLQLTTPDYKETVNRFQDSTGIYFYPIKELSYSGTLEINQPFQPTAVFTFNRGYRPMTTSTLTSDPCT